MKLNEVLMPLTAAPMILMPGCQERVAKSQFRFGQIAPHEITRLQVEFSLVEAFACQQQACATVEQQPRGFRRRNFLRIQVMLATGEDSMIAANNLMSRDQVITEH